MLSLDTIFLRIYYRLAKIRDFLRLIFLEFNKDEDIYYLFFHDHLGWIFMGKRNELGVRI